MFHRVKSETLKPETQDSENTVVQQNNEPVPDQSVKEAKPELAEVKSESAEPEASKQEAPKESQAQTSSAPEAEQTAQNSSTPNTSKQETSQKENKTMSQNTQESTPAEPAAPQADASAFQRTGTAPAGSGYPGAYPSYGAAAANTSASGDRRLTIGAGITMSGEIESCDYLLVEGTVEAALKGASVLDIAESGVFYGTVEIDDATIAGRFEGDITAHGRLTLREGASVTGTIAYKELEIEAGAVIDGKLTPLQAAAVSAKPAPAKKEAAAKAGKPSQAQSETTPEPANTDGELFSKTAAAE